LYWLQLDWTELQQGGWILSARSAARLRQACGAARVLSSEFQLEPSAFGLYGTHTLDAGKGEARSSRLAAPGAHERGVSPP